MTGAAALAHIKTELALGRFDTRLGNVEEAVSQAHQKIDNLKGEVRNVRRDNCAFQTEIRKENSLFQTEIRASIKSAYTAFVDSEKAKDSTPLNHRNRVDIPIMNQTTGHNQRQMTTVPKPRRPQRIVLSSPESAQGSAVVEQGSSPVHVVVLSSPDSVQGSSPVVVYLRLRQRDITRSPSLNLSPPN